MNRRWRPSLGLVLGGALLGTLGLSFAGLVALRYLGPVLGFKSAAIILALATTTATVVLGWLLLRLILRPIRALEHYARAQEHAGHAAPPIHFGTRETAATARRVVAMAEALRDREATIRAFTDHVTHELKTPVSAIRAAAELLEDSASLSGDDHRLLVEIDGARTQIEAQLTALRDAAKARDARFLGQSELAGLLPTLSAEFPNLTLSAEGKNICFPIATKGMLIVLTQLLRNASEHGAKNLYLLARYDEGSVTLNVSNDGELISDNDRSAVFRPFFTTKRAIGGTGMGLSVVRNLLAAHHAIIELCRDQPNTTFRIVFHANDGED